MIQEARAAGNEIPTSLTPASENYYQQADIQEWMNASPGNLKLANDLRRKNGLSEIPAGGSAPFAPAPAAFSPRFDERMNRAGAYGMQSNLAPGAAQAVPGQDFSLGRQAVTDRTGMAFEPGFDLRQRETPGAYPMASVPVQTAFDPNLDLMGGGNPATAAPEYAQAFGQALDPAQDLSERYLRQIRGMRNPGMQNLGNATFRPGAYTAGNSLF